GKQRILGTIIGFLIFEIVFSIITDTMTRTLIILLVGYLSNYQTNYKNQMVCTTISALGAASIGANISILGFERLIFVLIGTLIALYANKIILPYKVSVAIKSDLKSSLRLNEEIISTLYKKSIGSIKFSHDLNSIIYLNKLLNKKINSNNDMLLSKEIDNYIYNQHIFMNEIRVLSSMFKDFERSNSDKLKLVYNIDYLTNKDLSKEETLKYIDDIDDILSQLILINLLNVKSILSDSKSMYHSIAQVLN
ncbi:MAG: FUSC family protein, partial [Paraclostridium sp.]